MQRGEKSEAIQDLNLLISRIPHVMPDFVSPFSLCRDKRREYGSHVSYWRQNDSLGLHNSLLWRDFKRFPLLFVNLSNIYKDLLGLMITLSFK